MGGRPRVLSFESRRQSDMASLIDRHGGEPTVAPSMQEVPLGDNTEAIALVGQLRRGEVDVVVFMTGVGARTLLAAVEGECRPEEFFELLEPCRVVVRGPKPTAVLREWGVRIDGRAPEPNTWRELLGVLEQPGPLEGQSVAVQEYGVPSDEFYEALTARGARVLPVPVYRWSLPDDTAPLEAAVAGTLEGRFDVLLFTSANQLTNVLEVASRAGVRDEWLAAAGECLVGSIGPTASAALRDAGLRVDVEPAHPKMGSLVRETLGEATSRTRPPSSPSAP